MSDKLEQYRQAKKIDAPNRMWTLYGAGLENLGLNGKPIEAPIPEYGDDQLLVRHDACGLCFSDIKVITLGQEHPRIFRDIKQEPVVLGHEVTMTVVGVGEKLRDQYKVGDRFIIQADILSKGIGYAYGYMIQGGLSKYGIIDQRVLNGDDGNYLIPIRAQDGYAETALAEPWACVVASYQLNYRTGLKADGTTWIIGVEGQGNRGFTLALDQAAAPARILLTAVPADLEKALRAQAEQFGIVVENVADVSNPPVDKVDDIVVLGADAELIETVSPKLANGGIVAILAVEPFARSVQVDIGRIHYNDWLYVGSSGTEISDAYKLAVRTELKPEGKAWFVGAGGPIGHMHVQRAVNSAHAPRVIVCTDVSDVRLNDVREAFSGDAQAKGIEFLCVNPTRKEEYESVMARFLQEGFDDIVTLAPIAPVISDAARYLAEFGVMNIFAGVNRGTMAALNLSNAFQKSVRIFGHSASSITDLRVTLNEVETGRLSTNRSVAAIGSLNAAKDGLKALKDATYPGKVVIFPNIKELPLTALPDLKNTLPSVYAKLREGREWTPEAEQEFLRIMLED